MVDDATGNRRVISWRSVLSLVSVTLPLSYTATVAIMDYIESESWA
jgi:hypothetical protein